MPDTPYTEDDRLPLLPPDSLTPAQNSLHERIQADQIPWAEKSGFEAALPDGRLLGPFNALLYGPEVGAAYLDYFAAEKKNTSLSERVHEIVILTVGAAWGSAYELYAHTAVGKSVGLSEPIINAILAGQTPQGLSAPEAAAYEFTRQLAETRRVDAATYARTQAALGDKGLVDIVMLTGLYLTTCALLNAFQVPVPE